MNNNIEKFNIKNNTVIFFIYFLGIIHWYYFINFGYTEFSMYDWVYTYPLHDLLKISITTFEIPYHAKMYNLPIEQYSDVKFEARNGPWIIRWFAHGHPLVSPHFFLIAFFDLKTMITLNIIFHYSIGFLGIYFWINKFKLSIFSSFYLILLFNLNGFLISKMSIGHLGFCSAYFYIPLFLFLLNFFCEKNKDFTDGVKKVIYLALFIFLCKLNGNGQNIYQFLLVSSIYVFFFPNRWIYFIFFLVLSFLLLSFYVFPTLYYSDYINSIREIQWGYGTGPIILDNINNQFLKIFSHIVNIIYDIIKSLTIFVEASKDKHETNLYISLFGLIIIFISIILFLKDVISKKIILNYKIFISFLIVSILSVSHVKYEIIGILNIFVNIPIVDRLPSRLAIYPLAIIFLISANYYDKLFRFRNYFLSYTSKIITVLVLMVILILHSFKWFLFNHNNSEKNIEYDPTTFGASIIHMYDDIDYIELVNISYLISGSTLFLTLIILTVIFNLNKFNFFLKLS